MGQNVAAFMVGATVSEETRLKLYDSEKEEWLWFLDKPKHEPEVSDSDWCTFGFVYAVSGGAYSDNEADMRDSTINISIDGACHPFGAFYDNAVLKYNALIKWAKKKKISLPSASVILTCVERA